MTMQRDGSPDLSGGFHEPELADRLVRMLRREAEILEGLRAALVDQRKALAESNAREVGENAGRISRVLSDLDEARSVRETLLASLPGAEPITLKRLETAFVSALPGDLARAREELFRRAASVERETTVNRRILDQALRNGASVLQTLFTEICGTRRTYGPGAGGRPQETVPGLLTNKVV